MSSSSRENMILFPFMAQGHLIPYLALALQKYNQNLLNYLSLVLIITFHQISENTDVLPYPLIINLLESLRSLKPHFHKFISDHLITPPCIISNTWMEFSSLYSIWINQPQIHQKDSEEILVPRFLQKIKFRRSQLSNLQLQATGLSYFKSKLGQNSVWAGGPVSDYSLALSESNIITTILYISFGSQDTISRSQIMELAIGLQKRQELHLGLLVRKWAPQLEILSHKCTSTFLSHCGWNSVLESLSFGVPVAADQLSNSKLFEEEMGVCVELAKRNRNEVEHEDVVRVINLIMNKKELEMSKKAFKVKNAIREDEGLEGSSVKGIKEFFAVALSRKKEMKMDHHGNYLNTTSSEV
ncbi:hypothetical protein MKX01_042106 [Papaver californicum]|nr:hypothetical protein MKX01_042106 [Papaver californicum]